MCWWRECTALRNRTIDTLSRRSYNKSGQDSCSSLRAHVSLCLANRPTKRTKNKLKTAQKKRICEVFVEVSEKSDLNECCHQLPAFTMFAVQLPFFLFSWFEDIQCKHSGLHKYIFALCEVSVCGSFASSSFMSCLVLSLMKSVGN